MTPGRSLFLKTAGCSKQPAAIMTARPQLGSRRESISATQLSAYSPATSLDVRISKFRELADLASRSARLGGGRVGIPIGSRAFRPRRGFHRPRSRAPCSPAAMAELSPAGPAPTTSTSQKSYAFGVVARGAWVDRAQAGHLAHLCVPSTGTVSRRVERLVVEADRQHMLDMCSMCRAESFSRPPKVLTGTVAPAPGETWITSARMLVVTPSSTTSFTSWLARL